jgi:hypothetical protein
MFFMNSLFSTKTQAQQEVRNIPSLNNHEFIGTTIVKLPFNNTSFEMDLGVGSTVDFTFPLVEIDGQPVIGLDGDIFFALLGFKYSQKIRKGFSFNVNYSLAARIGTNVQSVLVHGINTVSGYKAGVMFKLFENKKHRLSGSVDLYNSSGSFINIKRFVQDILDSIPNPSISQDVPVLLGSAGLYHAWGLTTVTGINFHAVLAYGESFDRKREEFRYDLGIGFDFNFYRRYNIPIGVSLSYNALTQPDLVYLESEAAHVAALKIAFTGTPDFILAVENATMSVPVEESSNQPFFLVTGVSMKYYFN